MSAHASHEALILDNIRKIGRHSAFQFNIPSAEIEDCIQDFVVKWVFLLDRTSVSAGLQLNHSAFLQKSARNHCFNYKRSLAPRLRSEIAPNGDEMSAGCVTETMFANLPDAEALHIPGTTLFRQLFWAKVAEATTGISPELLDCFLRHHLGGELLSDMTKDNPGRTNGALRVSMTYTRKRLCFLLLKHGVTEETLRDLLSDIHG